MARAQAMAPFAAADDDRTLMSPAPEQDTPFDPATAFRSLSNQNGHVYRAIVGVLSDSMETFVTEVTEADLLDAVNAAVDDELALGGLRAHLKQLELDHLVTSRVNESVTSLADVQRRGLFWSLTAVGRAVQQALVDVAEAFGSSGALRLTALSKIVDTLQALRAADPADSGEVLLALESLFNLQRTFHDEAEQYVRRLTDADVSAQDEEVRFQHRKQALRSYLLSFLGELEVVVPRLAQAATDLQHPNDSQVGIEQLIASAVLSRDVPDGPERQRREQRLRKQWHGLYSWYAADPPRVRTLRDHARTHANGLARQLSLLNMQRVGTRRLPDQLLDAAAYLHAADDDAAAWARFAAIAGLHPATHLQLLHEDPDDYVLDESWTNCEPVPVPVLLRDLGNRSARGRTGKLPDRSAERALLTARRRARKQAAADLVRRFATRGAFHVSDIGALDHDEFAVLLETLSAALSNAPSADGTRSGTHPHADLVVTLTPPAAGRPHVRLDVGDEHVLVAPDHLVELTGADVATHLHAAPPAGHGSGA